MAKSRDVRQAKAAAASGTLSPQAKKAGMRAREFKQKQRAGLTGSAGSTGFNAGFTGVTGSDADHPKGIGNARLSMGAMGGGSTSLLATRAAMRVGSGSGARRAPLRITDGAASAALRCVEGVAGRW